MTTHLTRLRGTCQDGNTCVTVWHDNTTGDVYLQGYQPSAAELAALPVTPDGEAVIRVPAADAHLLADPHSPRR